MSSRASQLTDVSSNMIECMSFNLRMLFTLSLTILLFCLLMSCMSSLFTPLEHPDMIRYNRRMRCLPPGKLIEDFSNDELFSFKKAPRSNYQTIPLLANNNENLLFGEARRFILPGKQTTDRPTYRLEVNCNLFVLDGNIYNKTSSDQINHKYSVILHQTEMDNKLVIGDLKKDGDGIYKLKFISTEVEKLLEYDRIDIVYDIDGKQQRILTGSF